MSQEFIIYLFIAAAAGAVTAYLFFKIRFEQGRAQLVEARTQLAERAASYEREQEIEKKNALTVLMYPYKQELGDDGYFSDDRQAEIGYQYQLFVAGVPCFAPHKIPLEVLSKKEVNSERIEQVMKTTFSIIETLACRHPAFAAIKSAPGVSEHVGKVVGKVVDKVASKKGA